MLDENVAAGINRTIEGIISCGFFFSSNFLIEILTKTIIKTE